MSKIIICYGILIYVLLAPVVVYHIWQWVEVRTWYRERPAAVLFGVLSGPLIWFPFLWGSITFRWENYRRIKAIRKRMTRISAESEGHLVFKDAKLIKRRVCRDEKKPYED